MFRTANPGDVIHVTAGTYGSFAASAKTGFVTIQADPGVSATMALSLNGAAFVRFSGLTLSSASLTRSHDIELLRNRFTGAVRIDTLDNSDTHILMDGNTHDGVDVCSTCYEGSITVKGVWDADRARKRVRRY